ncbi:MAG: molecular chaperone TorD family protein [Chloroflexi bacterium]|nr:molecular chaperone TorD family protein [Chloroflexota bacterium]
MQTPFDPPAAIEVAVARSFVHRFLAKAFEDPDPKGWAWLTYTVMENVLETAAQRLADDGATGLAVSIQLNEPLTPAPSGGEREFSPISVERSLFSDPIPALAEVLPLPLEKGEGRGEGLCPLNRDRLVESARQLRPHFKNENFDAFQADYLAAFGHTVRGDCPMNEIEYGDIKADPLFQPHRLADLGAFYRAFGLEVSDDAAERHDHICLELEFMSVLSAKEGYALQQHLPEEQLELCRQAQKKFLRGHLGRWTPAFTRRLARAVGEGALGALANFTRAFIEAECRRFGITPGSEDLLLRPVDESAESLCTSCGLNSLPPGALAVREALSPQPSGCARAQACGGAQLEKRCT